MGVSKEQLGMSLQAVKDYVDSNTVADVTVSQTLTEGDEIATITVDGQDTKLFAPPERQVDVGTVFRRQTTLWKGDKRVIGTLQLLDDYRKFDEIVFVLSDTSSERTDASIFNSTILVKDIKEDVPDNIAFHGYDSRYAAGGFSEDKFIISESNTLQFHEIIGVTYSDTYDLDQLIVRKSAVLYTGSLSAAGTYKLNDVLSNYDTVYVEHTYDSNFMQSMSYDISEGWKSTTNAYHINHGNGSGDYRTSFHFTEDGTSIVIDSTASEYITKIVGYKHEENSKILYENTFLSPQVYSEEEKVVGHWTNGKPVYRKVINLDDITHSDISNSNSVFIPNSDYIDCVISSTLTRTTSSVCISLASWFTGSDLNLLCANGSCSYSASYVRYVILEYTKVEDTENSFDAGMIDSTALVPNKYISYESYSEEETVIGQWTDGKPIYRKAKLLDSLPKSTTNSIDMGLTSVDKLLNLVVNVKRATGGQWEVYNIAESSEAGRTMLNADGTLGIRNKWDVGSDVVIVVEYTKTTDAANSFNVNMLSATSKIADNYMVGGDVYSQDEIVVGKWIDGRPLYRKAVDFGNLPNSTTKNVAHGIEDIDKVVNIGGYVYEYSTSTFYPTTNVSPDNIVYAWNYIVSKSSIHCTTKYNFSSKTAMIIIEYTKTTDSPNSFKPEMLPSIIPNITSPDTATDSDVNDIFN